jgi:hypothetical protein
MNMKVSGAKGIGQKFGIGRRRGGCQRAFHDIAPKDLSDVKRIRYGDLYVCFILDKIG